MNGLFNDDIGKKIKATAIVGFIIESIAAIIVGFIAIIDEEFGIGFSIIIGGILGAYLIAMFTYAFGVLVDKTVQIASNTGKIKSPSSQSISAQPSNAQRKAHLKDLYEKGLINADDYNRAIEAIDAGK